MKNLSMTPLDAKHRASLIRESRQAAASANVRRKMDAKSREARKFNESHSTIKVLFGAGNEALMNIQSALSFAVMRRKIRKMYREVHSAVLEKDIPIRLI